jgi:hypothetical protein
LTPYQLDRAAVNFVFTLDQPELNFGTQARKLVRRDDPDTSHDAAKSVDTSRLEAMVYDAIKTFGETGCISDQIRDAFPNMPYSSVTARYKALMDKGMIVDTGKRKPGKSGRGQRVMRISNAICATA